MKARKWLIEYVGVRFGEPLAEVRAKTLIGARRAAIAGCALVIADTARIYERTSEGLTLRDVVACPRDDDFGVKLNLHHEALFALVRRAVEEVRS